MTLGINRSPTRIALFAAIALLTASPAAILSAASLQNSDSQAYNLVITEMERPYSASYQIIENSQVELCFMGCAMTLLATGQTIEVGPQDTVVIDNGAMTVTTP